MNILHSAEKVVYSQISLLVDLNIILEPPEHVLVVHVLPIPAYGHVKVERLPLRPV
jgi:hypothetical protein